MTRTAVKMDDSLRLVLEDISKAKAGKNFPSTIKIIVRDESGKTHKSHLNTFSGIDKITCKMILVSCKRLMLCYYAFE